MFWTVLETGHKIGRRPASLCRCVCGTERLVVTHNLSNGSSQSCGCQRRVTPAPYQCKRHSHPMYFVWSRMRERCNSPTHRKYALYGGRGIQVCDRWNDFENFVADMGPRPSPKHSIDRIDNDGNYEPGNCRWATPKEQGRNLRTNRAVIRSDGERFGSISEAAESVGLPTYKLKYALRAGKQSGGYFWQDAP